MANGDDEFQLDIPTPAGTAGEMLDDFAGARGDSNAGLGNDGVDDGGVMEDTIMADFMVDDIGGSKPDTPSNGQGTGTPQQQQQPQQQSAPAQDMVDFAGGHAEDVLDLQGSEFMADMGGGGGNGQQQQPSQ